MRKSGLAAGVAFLWASAAAMATVPADPPPPWAFITLHQGAGAPPPNEWITVPGSALRVSAKKADDPFADPDWFPQDHPPMPAIVAHGRPPLPACSYCHTAVGVGDPASAALAGLPAAYIEQQLAEFRAGRRHCAVANAACDVAMRRVARGVTAADARAAAIYFSNLRYRSRIRVIEAALVPKTRYGSLYPIRLATGGREPIGLRILEMPDDLALEHDGDWRAPITAYVPPGSVARGRALVRNGAGAAPCTACHGARLQGVGMAPPLAGRPPTYIVRQLYDIQHGYRGGSAVALMRPEVALLTPRDRIDIAAFLAALPAMPTESAPLN